MYSIFFIYNNMYSITLLVAYYNKLQRKLRVLRKVVTLINFQKIVSFLQLIMIILTMNVEFEKNVL